MAVSWMEFEELSKREFEQYEMLKRQGRCNGGSSSLTWAEVQRLLWCTRKYKEMMREYARFFKTHKIKNLSELADKLAAIEESVSKNVDAA